MVVLAKFHFLIVFISWILKLLSDMFNIEYILLFNYQFNPNIKNRLASTNETIAR